MQKIADLVSKLFDGNIEYLVIFLIIAIFVIARRWFMREFKWAILQLDERFDDLDERDRALEKKVLRLVTEVEEKTDRLKDRMTEEFHRVDQICQERFNEVNELKGAHGELKVSLAELEKSHREGQIETKLTLGHQAKEISEIHRTVDKLFDMLNKIDGKLNQLIGAQDKVNGD